MRVALLVVALPVLALLALVLPPGVPARAAESTLWDHNGSVMRLHADGNRRVIAYETPRPGISGTGVSRGDILFDGVRTGNRISGRARVYRAGCRRAEYPVSGTITSETHFVLQGAAPVWAPQGCRVVGSDPASGSARLEFRYLRRAE